jgi:predicted PurR-regulated permease PerM
MNESSASRDDRIFQRNAIEAAIRIGLVMLLVVWCFNIVKPFALLLLWGAIIAVAVYPLFMKFQSLLGGRQKLAATLMVLSALAMLITPTIMLSESVIDNSETLAKRMQEGTFTIPPPADKVRSWPLVGEKLYEIWSLAYSNLGDVLDTFGPHLRALANKAMKKSLSAAARAGVVILQFIISIFVAGALLVYAQSSSHAVERVTVRLMGEQGGKNIADMAGATIRSVAQGVLGVAVIQAVLAGIGLFVMGVPYAGLWTLLVLVLAIIQLPIIIVLGPIIVYVFSVTGTLPAVIFLIWNLLVGVSDSFLKPLLLGRGLAIPMPVILLGAIGGMLLSGIIGLFVGAVVLAVGYTLFMLWLNEEVEPVEQAGIET